jgi:hypothetical protein
MAKNTQIGLGETMKGTGRRWRQPKSWGPFGDPKRNHDDKIKRKSDQTMRT